MYYCIQKSIHNKQKILFYIYFIDKMEKCQKEFSAVKWKNVTFEVSNIDSVQRGRHGGQ